MKALVRVKFAAIAAAVSCLMAALPARADSFFDFEDGTLQGWLSGTTGGTGSSLIELRNGSQMASAQHTGTFTTSLSHDFAYFGSDPLSFNMQAIAVSSTSCCNTAHAYSGVTVSFLNAFNVSLGSFSLFNTTNAASLGPKQFAIDNLQHNYLGTMSSFAAQAGVNTPDQIATISLAFTAQAETAPFYGAVSSSKVWFDNVRVGAVPEPDAQALLLAGLGVTLVAARRLRRRSSDDPVH
jgi:hypothetical protein